MRSHRQLFQRARLLIGGAALASGCGGDAAGPAPIQVEGRYALERIGERMIPIPIAAGSRGYIWYDTLTLSRGVATQAYAYRDSTGPTTFTQSTGRDSVAYQARRDTVFRATAPGREDTLFVSAGGVRSTISDPTMRVCPTGRCDYLFRRVPSSRTPAEANHLVPQLLSPVSVRISP